MRVEVHDTGRAFLVKRARVFDRFYRGDKSRSSESGHAGLGLSIARSILELHGQSIDFVSTPEQGTTFFFELPLVTAHAPVAESPALLSRPDAAAG
jgi:signal transduction histidine kinase